MSNNLVAYSREGDVFHYRWAARRCLRLIYPNSPIINIHIEGTPETQKDGEYVIDVAEYGLDKNKLKQIDIYQLKHTSVRQDQTFTISDLEDTFEGFAARYLQHKSEIDANLVKLSFSIITNRKIADSLKENLLAIIRKEEVNQTFQNAIEKYTKLSSDDLISFCNIINLEDREGNYIVQRENLQTEFSQLIAGATDNLQIENLIALVHSKVLSDSDHKINREEILKRFGITSVKQLYPALPKWENSQNIIKRDQHNILKDIISKSQSSIIVTAAGGVGKSVFCRELINSLPDGSIGIAYDCFGAGSYRNPSETRHTYKDALVQIINELASKGLCNPLLPIGSPSDKDLVNKFLLELENSVTSLKNIIPSAQLFILIDAADNAEMAAKELSQNCFAHGILREKMPSDCKLVLLCRTERISYLQPPSFITQHELKPFSEEESLTHLRKYFSDASEKDGLEFHRLTSQNPRVQANALFVRHSSVNELLSELGPSAISVEKQIETQLNSAVLKIKDQLTPEYHNQINLICRGLASLPPHIPIEVLSKIAMVSTDTIKSFVSDIGPSLWFSDTSIQFKDEPTETWFRTMYLASKESFAEYVSILEPLANQSSYISEVLPQLYLQAGQYNKLIETALSDTYLPTNSPIDARNIRVYRLQYAFKAALKINNHKDAIKLSMRAGEEVAGNQRQLALFHSNIDLLIKLQSQEKVQEIAFKRLLSSNWDGSENIYSASLLSGIKDYHGEARGYLRAATNWLRICFEEQRKKKIPNSNDGVQDEDILELTYAHLNIYGVKACADLLSTFKPKEAIYRTVKNLARRLIDLGQFKEINEFIINFNREPYFLVAVIHELHKTGRFPKTEELELCLDLLCCKKTRITTPNNFLNQQITPGIISFLEVCMHRKLSTIKILRVLRFYVPIKATRISYTSNASSERTSYFKALAIRSVLSNELDLKIDAISPTEFCKNKKSRDLDDEVKKFKEIVYGLYPWYLLRAQIISGQNSKLLEAANLTSKSSSNARTTNYGIYDSLPNEISCICISILIFYNNGNKEEIADFYNKFIHNEKSLNIEDKLIALNAIYRTPHLTNFGQELELSIYELIKNKLHDDGPEEIANEYILLARAVLTNDPKDSIVYFDEAINIASKFGDELIQRWEAIISLGKKACENKVVSHELAYRFIRCAELVGENVYREKHWNRNKAMQLCARLSPSIGLSALSRWRDRNVGHFPYQFEAVLQELVEAKTITPSTGWALCRLFSSHYLNNFLSICLKVETSSNIKENIFQDAVYLLEREGAGAGYWSELKELSLKYKIVNETINFITNHHNEKESKSSKKDTSLDSAVTDTESEKKWDIIFENLTIYNPKDFSTLIYRFKLSEERGDFTWRLRYLLKEAINRLDPKFLEDFINTLFLSDDIDHQVMQNFIFSLPESWTAKASYKYKLPDLIYRFGEKYARELCNKESFNYCVNHLNLASDLIKKIQLGILSGLSNGNEQANSDTFFGFANLASTIVTNNDAIDLVDYSLSRFELHISEDFGDGSWTASLEVTDDPNYNVAGVIWSALGSPRAETRWNAVHCTRKMADFNCTDIINNLVKWLKHDKVDAFGHHKFPFYNLHARQYLLIAFARISIENPSSLKTHSELFLDYALKNEHFIIQKFASDIILNIEIAFPKTYNKNILAAVNNIGKSPFPFQQEEYGYSTESYLHKEGKVKTDLKYRFAWDFDSYWHEPLGDLFGVPGKQINDLAANAIVKEWNLGYEEGYNNDPRVGIWNQSSRERDTWHDHGSYPRVDNLDFYMSYHSMFVVAARLIEKMPIIKKSDWYDDPLLDWKRRHLLTCQDGKWLADHRDALPLNRPQWILEEKKDSWQTDIIDEDFLSCLKDQKNGDLWINVRGNWDEKNNERTETFSISTALVSPKSSNALLRALITCSDPYDYSIPNYKEDDAEIESGIFHLKGWINERNNERELDEYDPYADGIKYPPYSIGNSIIESLGITNHSNEKIWKTISSNEEVALCETWSSHRESRDEEPDQIGICLKFKLSFLTQLCSKLGYELIFKIGIKREIGYNYRRDQTKYATPKYKIFILSSDGKIRNTDTDYQLG